MSEENKKNEPQSSEQKNSKVNYETKYELEKRLHTVISDLQKYSNTRRNEAIALTVGLFTLISIILNITGKKVINDKVNEVIGNDIIQKVDSTNNFIKNSGIEVEKSLLKIRKVQQSYNREDMKLYKNLKWEKAKATKLPSTYSNISYAVNNDSLVFLKGNLTTLHLKDMNDGSYAINGVLILPKELMPKEIEQDIGDMYDRDSRPLTEYTIGYSRIFTDDVNINSWVRVFLTFSLKKDQLFINFELPANEEILKKKVYLNVNSLFFSVN